MAGDQLNSEVPAEVWDGLEYTSIHAAILFADLENSVLLSSTLDPADYQRLINSCQQAMYDLIGHLKELDIPVSEYRIAGDELCIFFYDPEEVERNFRLDGPDPATGDEREKLIEKSRLKNMSLVFDALRAAIMLKNSWLSRKFNMTRVRSRREPLGLGIGVHTGRVHLCNRPDGLCRIEGYTVNLAKRIENYSRQGKFSRIMFSQEAKDVIRSTIRGHTMLRQRIFFHDHEVGLELLKGITRSRLISELKFFSMIGVRVPPAAIEQYEALFTLDPNNIWAYYQLFEHYAYVEKDWEKVLHHAKRAQLVHPNDEKVLLDLSRYHAQTGGLDQAERFAQQALALNPSFDLVYEHLASLSELKGESSVNLLEHMSKANCLTPGSPINHLNFGIALCKNRRLEEAEYHLNEAFRLYPEFMQNKLVIQELQILDANSNLPHSARRFISN